jgi:hypothetical protein
MIEDYLYEFRAPFNNVPSKCRIRTFQAADEFHKGDFVIIASQLLDDPDAGMSVTNACEYIATVIMRKHDVNPGRMIWIEHYPYPPKRGRMEPNESFDRVTFAIIHEPMNTRRGKAGMTLQQPRWNHIAREQVEALIGETL